MMQALSPPCHFFTAIPFANSIKSCSIAPSDFPTQKPDLRVHLGTRSCNSQAFPVLLTATSQTSEPAVEHRPLARVLYAVLLDPSRKFGSLEEQVFILAREFRDRGGFFLPLFSAPP